MKVIAATNNNGKLAEISKILGEIGIEVIGQKEFGINIEVEETGSTFEENAILKAAATAKIAKLPALSDDSGLCVNALDGRPGIYSARYAGEDATDADRVKKLLGELENVADDKRSAYFVSAVVLVMPDGKKFCAEGRVNGKIAYEPTGDGGFGYDPVFIPDGYTQSFGELTAEQKNKISHRFNALNNLKNVLKEQLL